MQVGGKFWVLVDTEGRKMHMARARDIAIWLASLDTVIENTSASSEEG